ncbi:MAG: phosphonate C-P lyase system protein PhnG [Rhodospirillaceae bacterium]|nr:phosphonate C-P lyase system protein PhnG [Rhodospirillaceae bacterium]
MAPDSGSPDHADRSQWMRTLALADPDWLENRWATLPDRPDFVHVRAPETGLVMVRGRMSGTGDPFNLGEMTMTRCSVRLRGGAVGHGYVRGRSQRHAELAAVFDALMQDPARRDGVAAAVIGPARRRHEQRQRAIAEAAAATRVEFFTLPREHA